jgi:hypothetical protein
MRRHIIIVVMLKKDLGYKQWSYCGLYKAIEINPQYARAYYNRAITYYNEGKKH